MWPLTISRRKKIDGINSRSLKSIKNVKWYHHIYSKELHTSAHILPPHSYRLQTLEWICPLPLSRSCYQGLTFIQHSSCKLEEGLLANSEQAVVIKENIQRLNVILKDAVDLAEDYQ